MKNNFFKGMGNFSIFPPATEVKPVRVSDAYANVCKSFLTVANTMNSIFYSEVRKSQNAKTK